MHKNKFKWITGVVVVLYVLCIVFFYKLPFSSSIFQDVPDSNWASYDIQFMYNHGLMQGRDSSVWNFYPDASMSRAELEALMLKIDGVNTNKLPKPTQTTYADVPTSNWAAGVVQEAKNRNLIPFNDVTADHFYPDKPVTRAELAEAVCMALKIPTNNVPSNANITLPDIKGNPYEAAIKTIVWDKYAQGNDNGLFEPNSIASRAEVASVFAKAIQDVDPNIKSPTSSSTSGTQQTGGGK